MPKIDAPTLAEHHAQRRAAILGAAAELLLREGAGAVTPAAVAAASGLARSSVYQYYASTGALLGAAVEQVFATAQHTVDLALDGAVDPADRIRRYLEVSVDLAIEGHMQIEGLRGLETPMPPECVTRMTALHTALVEPLTAALEEAGTAEPELVAAFLNGLVGAAAGQITRGADAAAVRRTMHRLVSAALGLPSA